MKGNIFKDVPLRNIKRNLFDLSHEVKMSGKFGYLYPILLMDCMPGDTVRDQMTAMVRFAPMLSPIMHRVDVKTDFFFVPTRILSDSWQDFITGGQDGTLAPILPYITPAGLDANGWAPAYLLKGTLWDYLGLPVMDVADPAATSTERISVLPIWAYIKIYNDYFRDPNLDTEVEIPTELLGDVSGYDYGPDDQNIWYRLRRRGWDRGYFTSALPWAQRGPSVLMPFDAEVTYREQSIVRYSADGTPIGASPAVATSATVNESGGTIDPDLTSPTFIDNIESVSSSNITINDLRRSMAIQSWLENNARGGARYNEQIKSHFRVNVPDYRVQRAEYLGGGRQPVTISEVLSTADTTDVPVGDMAGHGISVGKSNQFTYHCQEHGFVIGIMSIVPKPSYATQGIPRLWTRLDKFDYPWPELAHLGEQEILSKELFYSYLVADDAANNSVFGYIPRYSEFKYMEDRLAGDFRDDLLFWHLARKFTVRPTLSNEFLVMNEDGKTQYVGTILEETYRRIFAVQDDTDYLWIQLYHRLTAKRPLPYFGVPNLVG